ncbi:MAG: M15 family metallopeptidase [Oscillospiraceae bacterium]|nr:M15 family metallopeptidase [Oscillospiraceae bacterium]
MKKLICLLLAMALLLAAGCSKPVPQEEPSAADTDRQSLSEMVTAPAAPEKPAPQQPAEPAASEEPEQQPEELPEEPAEEEQEEEPIPEPEEEESDLPDVDLTSWELILANPDHNIEEYTPETVNVEGQPVDHRIVDPLNAFIAAARAEGLYVYLSSAYRDYATQSYLYNRKIQQYGDPEVAARIVAPPGTSEHQTGLALDITDRYYEMKDSSLENTALYQWMSAHCHEYGFIVRYPKDKEDVTGIIYEPWHFRYVGVEVATYIMENGLCLEEFLALYED